MGRVISEFTQGERLGILQQDASYQWLRTTEELFYKDALAVPAVQPGQPDPARHRATRRNAYFRMFGMDLNHGRDGRRSATPTSSRRSPTATSSPRSRSSCARCGGRSRTPTTCWPNNPTDFPAIQDLADRLQNMLTARRGGAVDSAEPRPRGVPGGQPRSVARPDAVVRQPDRPRPGGRRPEPGGATAPDRRARRPSGARPLAQLLHHRSAGLDLISSPSSRATSTPGPARRRWLHRALFATPCRTSSTIGR